MAMVRMTQAEEVQQVLGCSSSEARHYLHIFDGDQERAVRVVLQHMEDKDWWGHPWNSKESAELMDDDSIYPFSAAASESKEDASKDEVDKVRFFLLCAMLTSRH